MSHCGHLVRHLRARLADEAGFALVLALACCIVLSIATTSTVLYVTSNQHSATRSLDSTSAKDYAEAALNVAYSVLKKTADPTVSSALGGGTPQCVSVVATCTTSTTSGEAGTATYTGTYSSSTSKWTIVGAGYAAQGAQTVAQSMTASVSITANIDTPTNIAVWNYIYSTAPQGAGCEFNITDSLVYIDVPVYVTGDMCMSGFSDSVWEKSGGQPVSLQVLGKLVMTNSSDSVGYKSCDWSGQNCTISKITSGGVGLGCATSSSGTTSSCTSGSFQYYVKNAVTPTAYTPPSVNQTTVYAQADPGPDHPCLSGTSPAPLAQSSFDNDTSPNDSASAFNLTPTTSYSCLSSDGTTQLSWNASTDTLTINGEVYFDGPVNITQSGTYQGLGTIYAAGAITFACSGSGSGNNSGGCDSRWANGQGGYYPAACSNFNKWGGWGLGWGCTSLCANTSCNFNTWDPTKNMLLLASLASNQNAINFYDNADLFQGGLFATTTGTTNFAVTGLEVQGPIVSGKFDFSNIVILEPLPTISSLPPGAPLSVNATAVVGPLNIVTP